MLDRLKARFRALRQRYSWLDHTLRGYSQYKLNQGDHQAAAITFFSFLSIFPMILLAVSVLGFVLAGNTGLRDSFVRSIVENVPGNLVTTKEVQKAIDARGSTGVIGIITLALTGAGWVDNLRSAVETVWGRRPSSRNFFIAKGGDLVVLILLAITLAVSFALTGFGTTLTGLILKPIGLDGAFWAQTSALIVGLLLAVAWDTFAFTIVIMRLPRIDVERSSAVKGSLLAAAGFELLKVGASYYLGSLTSNPAVAGFGSVVGLLIWLMLVSRFLLFCAAWTATFPAEAGTSPVLAVAEAAHAGGLAAGAPAGAQPVSVSPSAVAGGLVGVGAVLGAVGVVAAARGRRRDDGSADQPVPLTSPSR